MGEHEAFRYIKHHKERAQATSSTRNMSLRNATTDPNRVAAQQVENAHGKRLPERRLLQTGVETTIRKQPNTNRPVPDMHPRTVANAVLGYQHDVKRADMKPQESAMYLLSRWA